MLYKQKSKRLISLGASTILLFFIQTSHAYVNQLSYFGGQLGGSDLSYDASNLGISDGNSSSNGSGLAWHVFGGYQMNANFAIEAGFTEYNDVTIKKINGNEDAKATISEKSAELMGKLIYPVNSLFDIYVKGGIAYAVANEKVNSAAARQDIDLNNEHALTIAYAIGASYEFYPNVKLDLIWQRVAGSGGLENADFSGAGITLFFE